MPIDFGDDDADDTTLIESQASVTASPHGLKKRKVEAKGTSQAVHIEVTDETLHTATADTTQAPPTEDNGVEMTTEVVLVPKNKGGRPPKRRRAKKVPADIPATATQSSSGRSVAPAIPKAIPARKAAGSQGIQSTPSSTKTLRTDARPIPFTDGLEVVKQRNLIVTSTQAARNFLVQNELGVCTESSTFSEAFVAVVHQEMDGFDELVRAGSKIANWHHHTRTGKCICVRLQWKSDIWKDGKGSACWFCVRDGCCCIVINEDGRAVLLPLATQYRAGVAQGSIAYYVNQIA